MLPIQEFTAHFCAHCTEKTLIKLSLSKPQPSVEQGLQNVYARLVQLKTGLQVQFTLRYAFRDITKNLPIAEATEALQDWIENVFFIANLHTNDHIFTFETKNGQQFFRKTKNTKTNKPVQTSILSNNKEKLRKITTENNIWLYRLGIANQKGEVLKDKQAKFKQIDKYLEIMEGLLGGLSNKFSPEKPLKIVDMGAGKGYLTFGLYDLLLHKNKNPLVFGIEQRKDVVATANNIAEEAGFSKLHFVENSIQDYEPNEVDVLIALHACDTATDDALAKGIAARAELIVVAPCCHKQVRRAMQIPANLEPVFRHGILLERQAEMLTDAIRALILEKNGYTTKVFEFVSLEHTGKNVMITATKHHKKTDTNAIQAQIDDLKKMYGIQFHALERLI